MLPIQAGGRHWRIQDQVERAGMDVEKGRDHLKEAKEKQRKARKMKIICASVVLVVIIIVLIVILSK